MSAPTNTDLYREIKEMRKDQKDMTRVQNDTNKRVRTLEDWKVASEAVAAARKPILGDNVDWKAVAAVAATIIAAIYAAIKQAG